MTNTTDWPPCQVDENGLNTAIEGHVLDDQSMRAAGFILATGFPDNRPDAWYYRARIDRDVSFHVIIPKDGSRLTIDVYSDLVLRHVDYQTILHHSPRHPYVRRISEAVERQMAKLAEAGIITGHVPGDYI